MSREIDLNLGAVPSTRICTHDSSFHVKCGRDVMFALACNSSAGGFNDMFRFNRICRLMRVIFVAAATQNHWDAFIRGHLNISITCRRLVVMPFTHSSLPVSYHHMEWLQRTWRLSWFQKQIAALNLCSAVITNC